MRGAWGSDGNAVVDLTIAIVIQIVAYLRLRANRPFTYDFAVDALLYARLALAHIASTDHFANAIIDLPIAVVVDAIANFCIGRISAGASPGSGHAGQRADLARGNERAQVMTGGVVR